MFIHTKEVDGDVMINSYNLKEYLRWRRVMTALEVSLETVHKDVKHMEEQLEKYA